MAGSDDRSEAEAERPAQDEIMHEASAEPEKSLGANNIGAEQDKDKSSEIPEHTEPRPEQQQDQQQQQQDEQQDRKSVV